MPTINFIANSSGNSTPSDFLFFEGVYRAINIITLYILGTNFLSNTVSYLICVSIMSYQNFPRQININVTNYISAFIWLIIIKYISDKDRRS